MRVLIPVDITEDMLLSSTVPEADAPAWSAGTTYALGARVMRAHRVWESAQAGNLAKDPTVSGPAWWADLGPTNRWAAFDEKPSTTTTGTTSISWTLRPGVWTSDLALISAVGSSARVRVFEVDGVTVIYDQTKSLPGISRVSFAAWFFRDRLSIDGDLVFEGLPRRLTGSIEITLMGGDLSLGALKLGVLHTIGQTLAGATSDIQDYSRVDTDTFGNTSITRRARARKNSFQVLVLNEDLPRVRALRERISGLGCVFIGAGAEDMRSALLVYGLAGRMPLDVRGLSHSTYSLDVLGFA